MVEPVIRPVDLGRDADTLLELLDAYALDPMGGGRPLPAPVKAELIPRLRTRADYFGFIALSDGRPAGLVNCFEGFSTFYARPLMNIHDVVVLPEFRGQGLSLQLLEQVEQLARERGCCKLTLEVLSNNHIAKAAYQKFGFEGYELDPAAGQALFWEKRLGGGV
jgi:GNAT superfamily N-acetyltransferase